MKYLLSYFSIIILYALFLTGCKNNASITSKDDNLDNNNPVNESYTSTIIIATPLPTTQFIAGEEAFIKINDPNTTSTSPDSIQLFIDGDIFGSYQAAPINITLETKNLKMGNHPIKLIIYKNGLKDYKNSNFIVISDIVPKELKYTIVNTFKHDITSYTQGLVYDDGYLYEGSGQYGRSSLRKVEIETGEVLNQYNLSNSMFGEGVTLYQDRLYQLTWKSQVGFVYNKETFEILQKIYYRNRQGWGLTHDNETFIMSDGSSNLYLLDTQHFTETGKIEVYNNEGAVGRLNELEYINGKIYSNIYPSSQIIIIDPVTGKVENFLECKDLIPEEYKGNSDKVLNGIAYNPTIQHLYITGKDWPVLYEIKID